MNRPITSIKYIVGINQDTMEKKVNDAILEVLRDGVFDVIDIKQAMANDGGRYMATTEHSAMLLLSPKTKAPAKK